MVIVDVAMLLCCYDIAVSTTIIWLSAPSCCGRTFII